MKPRRGSLSSFVLWHVMRGHSLETIIDSAKQSRPSAKRYQISNLFDRWSSSAQYASRFERFSANTPLRRLSPPTSNGRYDMLRVYFDVTLNVPDKSGRLMKRTVSFSFDTAMQGTVGQIRQEAKDMALIWLSRFYTVRRDTLSRRKLDISFTQVMAS